MSHGFVPGKWSVMTQPWKSVSGDEYPATKYHYPPPGVDHRTHVVKPNIGKQLARNAADASYAKAYNLPDVIGTEGDPTVIRALGPSPTAQSTYAIQGTIPKDQGRWTNRASTMVDRRSVIGNTRVGQAFVPQAFWDFAQEKSDILFQTDFDKWRLSLIKFGDEPAMEWWRERFPDLVGRKLFSLDLELEVEKRLKKIQTLGISNMDDMWFLYNLLNNKTEEGTFTAIQPMPQPLMDLFDRYMRDEEGIPLQRTAHGNPQYLRQFTEDVSQLDENDRSQREFSNERIQHVVEGLDDEQLERYANYRGPVNSSRDRIGNASRARIGLATQNRDYLANFTPNLPDESR